MSADASLDEHVARTGTTYGACVVYPFHASYPGMPDLFHVRCSQHPDFGLCAEWDEARQAAVDHDATHRPVERCPECGGLDGAHGSVHTRYGNGGGGNRPCSRIQESDVREESNG